MTPHPTKDFMLDTDTKNRINTARDILVGKVPDPKSQVEQITIALIYKFMNDMDAEAEELGGRRTFFAGEFEKYRWANLMFPGMGGQEVLNLYAEALTRMNENAGIPPLFRDIFKNASLPSRDPETLKSFLKIIDDFSYDHSERLGDAFEYLLSVLGSQGDAGQFRTPRHIIDFMVAVLHPQKHETLLDPACGTAGFLISSYKHILKANTRPSPFGGRGAGGEGGHPGAGLSPDERTRLLHNIIGYDISPDMVRLSLVNLYLHGFTDPHIYEYDTLTSDDRWNDTFDLILANPPFMSPKGGIRPHNRFSVKSSRSEVLFVDYIAEHLNPAGRAAVIVPEGIIFQSQTAEKQLRKMLVDTALVGVISLPAGVFQPYSGVKTSILWLDKTLAKQTNRILFVKVANDGYDLGAQRREIKGSDLPAALEAIRAWQEALTNGSVIAREHSDRSNLPPTASSVIARGGTETESLSNLTPAPKQSPGTSSASEAVSLSRGEIASADAQNPHPPRNDVQEGLEGQYPNLLLVEKNRLAENGDYSLSGERYAIQVSQNSQYEFINIGDVFETSSGGTPLKSKREYWINGTIPWLKSGEVSQGFIYSSEEFITEEGMKNSSAKIFPVDSILIAMYGATTGQVGILKFESTTNQAVCAIYPNERAIPEYLYYILKYQKDYLVSLSVGGAQPNISQKIIRELQIPLPPLPIQQEIVAEIESYQRIIDGARQVVESYQPRIEIDPAWEVVALGEVCEVKSGGTPSRSVEKYWNGNIPWVKTGEINFNTITCAEEFITEDGLQNSSAKIIPAGTILMAMYGQGITRGKVAILGIDATINQACAAISITSNRLNRDFLFRALQGKYEELRRISDARGGNQSNLNAGMIRETKIPLPDLATQTRLVAQIEREQALVRATQELVEIFEGKIKARIAKVWEDEKG